MHAMKAYGEVKPQQQMDLGS